MIDKLFLAHPRSVDESYGEHFRVATRFGLLMLAGGIATTLHGFLPALFTRTGSSIVKKLYGEMRARQPGLSESAPAFASKEWQIEYEI